MSQRLRFVLDGDDRLSPVLNNAGDSSARLHRRLNDDMNGNAQAVRRFTQDAGGRLRDLRGRFISAADAARLMGDGMPGVTSRLGDLAGAGGDAASSLGRSGGGLGGAMLAVAGVAGLSLLPALGALVPMMAGAGLAAGTLKLGFAGVGDAMEAAGKGKKEYAEALKKLSPPARDFTKALVSLKKEFGGIGKDIQKAMLPGFTKAVKDAAPVVKILGKGMTELGGAFGKAAEGAGRLFKDSGFQKDLQTNLDLGRRFVEDMMSGFGRLGRSLLDFGAKSGPTLTALSGGISDLLGKGLPGMFKGLEPGIGGTAKMLDGLFSAVNSVLPAFGRLAGEMGKTLGPLFGQQFKQGGSMLAGAMDTLRGALVMLRPVIRDVGYGFKTILDVGRIIGPTLGDLGSTLIGAFAPVGSEVDKAAGPLQRLNQLVRDNKGAILEGARVFATGLIDMTIAAITAAPTIIKAFGLIGLGILQAIDVAVSASAHLFGWVPGIGGKLKSANKAFDQFKDGYISSLGTAQRKAEGFAQSTVPKLSAGKLKLNIDNWTQQIADAKAKLKTVPPSKRADLLATIADLEAKVRSAKEQLAGVKGKTVYVTSYFTSIYRVKKIGPGDKGYGVVAPGMGGATGGLVPSGLRRFATGGGVSGRVLEGPGTKTSDSLIARLSRGEFVMRAAAVDKYGVAFMEAVNTGRLGLAAPSGAGLAGAGQAAGEGLAAGLGGATGLVLKAAAGMAAGVVAGIKNELQIASPSKKTRALAKDVAKGFIEGLTGSRDKIKATAKDLATDIRTAFSGRRETALIKMVDKQTKKLLDLASKRDKIAATIQKAKEYASGVTSNARQQAGLANLGMQEGEVTAGGIKGGLRKKLEQIRRFTGYIKELAQRGLNKGLLRQILDMGPEQGYAYASALAGADKSTFNEINSLQKKISADTTSLGRIGADRLYDAGKNAGKGFLEGLKGQQKSIEKLMVDIARGMQKAIKKALGIKSPSTVMARLGEYSTQGLARGLVGGMPVLDRALDTVSGRVAATQPVIGRPAVVAGRGGGTVINIHVDGVLVDQLGAARAVRQALLDLKRTNGGGDLGIA